MGVLRRGNLEVRYHLIIIIIIKEFKKAILLIVTFRKFL